MQKNILITGATDGIGLETAKMLVRGGHNVLLHGRNVEKIGRVEKALASIRADAVSGTFQSDLSRMSDVELLAKAVSDKHSQLDVLINNAGVFKTSETVTPDGLDVRFAVNTIAPYLLTQRLLPLLGVAGRVVNVSSAAQSPVDLNALAGAGKGADDMAAYAQSKLAITMWSRYFAKALGQKGPVIVAVNPASMLGSKMVKEAFGAAGKDLGIGADILTRAAVSEEFASASGKYYDNDSGQFAPPHADALDDRKCRHVVDKIESVLASIQSA